MGGMGSGRYYGSGKDTTASYKRLDVRFLQHKGLLVLGKHSDVKWSRNGEPRGCISVQCEIDSVRLIYRHRRFSGEWQRGTQLLIVEVKRAASAGLSVAGNCISPGRELGPEVIPLRQCYA
jgi:hypothetical protein